MPIFDRLYSMKTYNVVFKWYAYIIIRNWSYRDNLKWDSNWYLTLMKYSKIFADEFFATSQIRNILYNNADFKFGQIMLNNYKQYRYGRRMDFSLIEDFVVEKVHNIYCVRIIWFSFDLTTFLSNKDTSGKTVFTSIFSA